MRVAGLSDRSLNSALPPKLTCLGLRSVHYCANDQLAVFYPRSWGTPQPSPVSWSRMR